MIIRRRKLLALAAPALILPKAASADMLQGFKTNYNNRAYPTRNFSRGLWNNTHPLAQGLQFAIHLGVTGNLNAYDFVNNVWFFNQNTGTSAAPLGGVTRGEGLRFTATSNGYLTPSVTVPAHHITTPYITNMLGPISIAWAGSWPVGATGTTSGYECAIFCGNTASDQHDQPFAFYNGSTMYLTRGGASGSDYYTAHDTGSGAGSEYTQSQITTLGVSQNGVFPSGAVRFYRGGKYTGAATIDHDQSTLATGTSATVFLGRSYYLSAAGSPANSIGSMIYGWNRVLADYEFMNVQIDPWWALRIPGNPMMAGFHPLAATVGRSLGIIIQ